MESQKQFKRRFSFEFFPPKTDQGKEKLQAVRNQLAEVNPDFFSVTFGAGGSTRDRTIETVLNLHQQGISTAPHLSCVGGTREEIGELLDVYKENGINRIVALRGDMPSGMGASGELRYANELVEFIRQHSGDHFNLEVAAYPEFHPQARNAEDDLKNFARKVQAGANSAITQYFLMPTATSTSSTVWSRWVSPFRWCRASCPSSTSPAWCGSRTCAARRSRAGSASSWKPTVTTPTASASSVRKWSLKCAKNCSRPGLQGCTSIL